MRRRDFIAGGAATLMLAALPAWSRSLPPQVPAAAGALVELINFSCARCFAVNAHRERLSAAAAQANLELRIAPVYWDNQSPWPSYAYYAARNLSPQAASYVLDELFAGMHQEGQKFEELSQVLAFLERRQVPAALAEKGITLHLPALAKEAASEAVKTSELKAARLLALSGADEVPVFLWVREGEVKNILHPGHADEPTALVGVVITALNESGKK